MSWTDRQRAMLRVMGVPLWQPPAHVSEAASDRADALPDAGVGTAPAPAPAPAPRPAPGPARAPVPVATAAAAAPPSAAVRPSPDDPVAALGWDDLRAAVAACQACTLAGTRTQTVFGVGHPQAPWMIVGEAPGEQEDLQGEPFVGAAGQLLDAMLHAVGLSRGEAPPERQVYIANTLKCRPPRNRNPEAEELARCEPFLQRQIALVQPRILLAMGRFAVQALLRSDEPIGRLRGRVHHYQGVPLVVTYHPAYLLRQPQDKAKAWEDLCLAASLLE
ncbi:uracil-DNA glycosylase family protein [Ideonella sp.]|uniref:uracil-DNA glycosylase n=1 Tax=Ideonella sp. TaxID=1929293 RepID=UPI0035B11009